jgi:hypothetical protein
MMNDREKVPLMKALHEVGLAHRVVMVVVAIPMDAGDPQGIRPLLIDHKDDTTTHEFCSKAAGAAVFLIKAAGAVEEMVMAKEEEGQE